MSQAFDGTEEVRHRGPGVREVFSKSVATGTCSRD